MATEQKASEGVLLGMGNPLLDISANTDAAFLKKYGLEADNAILAEEKHLPLYGEMEEKLAVDYIAGGATLNSVRVAQWIIGVRHATSYFGSVGDDAYASKLIEKAQEAGINVRAQVNKQNPTGTCAVLIQGEHRSLVANLAAANDFTISHFDTEANWTIVEKANFYYIAGFFLTVSPESILKVAEHAATANKCLTMNLSAPFLCQFFAEPMKKCLPYVDILVGNESEAAAISQTFNFGTEDLKEIALKLASLEKVNKARDRMVIFTQGSKSTLIAHQGNISEFKVIAIDPSEIVDTNGAGDAFVGGFLSEYIKGCPLERCVAIGHWAANYIIKVSGCTLTKNTPTLPC